MSLALIPQLAITLLGQMQVTKKLIEPPKITQKCNPLHLQMVGLQHEEESERESHLGLDLCCPAPVAASFLPCESGVLEQNVVLVRFYSPHEAEKVDFRGGNKLAICSKEHF